MFILDATRAIGANTSPPRKLEASSGKDPEQAFGELTKSKSDATEDSQGSKRTVARRAGKGKNADNQAPLFAITRDGQAEETPIFLTFTDENGNKITNKHICWA